jgi:lipopolysaccharide/colanic/teichoic acid biosynthesis glycosyltransferase
MKRLTDIVMWTLGLALAALIRTCIAYELVK